MKVTFVKLSALSEEGCLKLKDLGFDVEEKGDEFAVDLTQEERDWLIYVYYQACMKVFRKLAPTSPNGEITKHKDYPKLMEEVRKLKPTCT